jgi:hypothetical protein
MEQEEEVKSGAPGNAAAAAETRGTQPCLSFKR